MNKSKLKTLFNNLKNAFNKNKRKSITILVILILAIMSSVTLIAYSFYVNRSKNLIISGIASLDSSDVGIDVYRENRNSNGVGIGTYSLSYYVPGETTYTYNSSKTTCNIGVSISGFENNVFSINATKKGKCKVYFDAIDGYTEDYVIDLFVQQTIGNTNDKNYNQMGKLPEIETGYRFVINTSKTSCNPAATVSISGANIVVETTQKTNCTVYVDKEVYSASPTIGNITVSGSTVTATVTDNLGIEKYGFGTSNTVEPTTYYTLDEPTTSTTITDALENGTYYLWVKNLAGNSSVSSAFTISATTLAINNLATANDTISATFTAPSGISGYALEYDQYATPTVQNQADMINKKRFSFNKTLNYYGTYYLYLYDKNNASTQKNFTLKSETSPTISNVYWYGTTGSKRGLGFKLSDAKGLSGFKVVSSIDKFDITSWKEISGTSVTIPDDYSGGTSYFGTNGMNYIFVKNELGDITFYAKKVNGNLSEI